MTKTEAIDKMSGLNLRKPAWFCPLINETCNPRCICYVGASIYKAGDGYEVHEPFCSNPMLIGDE